MTAKHLMETPQISKTVYTNNTYGSDSFTGLIASHGEPWKENPQEQFLRAKFNSMENKPREKIEMPKLNERRIIQVFIVDPDDKVPLESAILYEGDQQLTDLTDEELFFEVPIKNMLEKHNEMRLATLDKKATNKIGKDIFLEPARIRDLRMTVVDIAVF